MTITKSTNENNITLALGGWLDVETVQELRDALAELPETEELVFDLKELEYISSVGIREIVSTHKKQRDAGHVFRITRVLPDVMYILNVTGLTKVIDISAASEEEVQKEEAASDGEKESES